MNWIYRLLAKFKRSSVEQQMSTLTQRYTHLHLCVGSNLTVDGMLLSIADECLLGPIPYDVIKSLTVGAIQKQRVFDTNRWLITFQERMPETGFGIYAEIVDDISSFTLWIVVDEFYMNNPTEWRETLADHTLDIVHLGEVELTSSHYIENMSVENIQGSSEITKLHHEKVWKHSVPSLSGLELFKKIIVNDARQQVAFGYEFTKAQVQVNY